MKVLASTHTRLHVSARRACSTIPLWRSWSARSVEAREVLVRFQRVGLRRRFKVTRRCATPALVGSIPTACSDISTGNRRCPGDALGGAEPLDVGTFCVYIDHETWAGDVHPAQALRSYRNARGIPAKLVVVGMTSNGFSIADPDDAGMLDVVGSTRRRLRSLPTSLARRPLRSCSEGAAYGDRCRRGDTPVSGTEAQRVERPFVKRMGAGSNPAGPAIAISAATAGHRRGPTRARDHPTLASRRGGSNPLGGTARPNPAGATPAAATS